MNKELPKAIMTRTRLGNKLKKFNYSENQLAYKRQRNYCVKFLKRSIQDFYNNLNLKNLQTRNSSGKLLRLTLLLKLSIKDEKKLLLKNYSRDKVITAETDLAKKFIGKFENIVESLHVERHCKVGLGREPVVNSIKNFSQHPSILKIKENTNSSASFSFHTVNKENLLYQLISLDPNETT